MLKKMLLIFNPYAGKAEFAPLLAGVVDRFTKAGYMVTAYPTQGPRDAHDMVLNSAADFDCLCCSGGDGTLNEVIGAMMMLPQKPVLGYIPSGTTNDFATSLKIPKDIFAAADTIINGNPFSIDIGCFRENYFAYVAAFGLFASVTYDTPQDTKNILGHSAYILEGVKKLASIKAYECEVTLDGKTISGNYIFGMASNSTSVGGFKVHSESSVSFDDGLFEVILVKKPRSFVDLQNIAASFLNDHVYTESFIVSKAASVRIVSKTPLDWTLDGEFGGTTTDVLIENKRRAFKIMLPKPEAAIF